MAYGKDSIWEHLQWCRGNPIVPANMNVVFAVGMALVGSVPSSVTMWTVFSAASAS